jgi:excisionase family DNA binding protein
VKRRSSGVSVTEEIESCVKDAVEEALSEHRQKEAAPSPLLKREEVAEILNISLRHLDTLVATGELTPVRIGRSVRFRPEAIRTFIEESTQEN